MKKIKHIFVSLLSTIIIATSACAATAENQPKKQLSPEETARILDLFGDVLDRVRQDYVTEISDQELVESALNGMLSSLDPHSGYMNKKSFDEMKVQTKGEFGGLGIEVTMENGLLKVIAPIDDTPAYKSGVKSGDVITQINDESIMGMTLPQAVEKLRGQAGTKVTISIVREGSSEPLEITLMREVIKIHSVKMRQEGANIGYIRINSFAEDTGKELRSSIEKFKKDMPNMKGVVLDLRNNPGGLLDQAIEVADAFLDGGEIVSTKGRIKDSNRRYNATKGDLIEGLPIVVLINGGSASASEIVSGAIQDQRRGVVMGTKSFGKGSVQTVIPLPAGAAMRLTTSRYYTPSGRSIQAEGIEPDIIVEPAKIEPLSSKSFYTEASLVGHLDKGNVKKPADLLKSSNGEASPDKAAEEKSATENKPQIPTNDNAAKTTTSKDKKSEQDYQLMRAVDLINGLSVYQGLKPKVAGLW